MKPIEKKVKCRHEWEFLNRLDFNDPPYAGEQYIYYVFYCKKCLARRIKETDRYHSPSKWRNK